MYLIYNLRNHLKTYNFARIYEQVYMSNIISETKITREYIYTYKILGIRYYILCEDVIECVTIVIGIRGIYT